MSDDTSLSPEAPAVNAKAGAAAVGLAYNSVIQIINMNGGGLNEEQARQSEHQYLRRLSHDCSNLEWLAAIRYQEEGTQGISLDSVYTALLTTTLEERRDKHNQDQDKDLDQKSQTQLSALAVLNKDARLVLTGDPGSGKSAFVNYLALCLAGEYLGDPQRNIQALTEPLPDANGEPQEQRQPWQHGALIPLRVILRDFAVSEYFPAENETGEAKHLLDFIKADLSKKQCDNYMLILEARMIGGEALVMLDGLDEVPQAGGSRERLIQCIAAFSGSYKARLLVTCRPYAYDKNEWQIPGFKQASIADFNTGQVRRFIDRWYSNRPEFDPAAAVDRANKLKQAAVGRENLRQLVKRPLLLTLMAYLHANHHELPERRADLYERLLELLIEKWEAARFKTKDAQDARQREQYSLAEFLQVGVDNIRLVLERLAFKAQALQSDLTTTADISAKDITHQLLCLTSTHAQGQRTPVDALAICEYLRDRVGIIYQRGGDSELDAVYSFPHRSFQEYLAACYFRREESQLYAHVNAKSFDEWTDLAGYLARSDIVDRWY